MKKKLTLEKEVIESLSENDLNEVQGGKNGRESIGVCETVGCGTGLTCHECNTLEHLCPTGFCPTQRCD